MQNLLFHVLLEYFSVALQKSKTYDILQVSPPCRGSWQRKYRVLLRGLNYYNEILKLVEWPLNLGKIKLVIS